MIEIKKDGIVQYAEDFLKLDYSNFNAKELNSIRNQFYSIMSLLGFQNEEYANLKKKLNEMEQSITKVFYKKEEEENRSILMKIQESVRKKIQFYFPEIEIEIGESDFDSDEGYEDEGYEDDEEPDEKVLCATLDGERIFGAESLVYSDMSDETAINYVTSNILSAILSDNVKNNKKFSISFEGI